MKCNEKLRGNDSAVPAWLGLKAPAWAWLERALASKNHRPSHKPFKPQMTAWPGLKAMALAQAMAYFQFPY
jgi:hypothetical protein